MIAASRAHAGTRPETPPTSLPERYVRIPQRLLSSAVYRPLQIGIYSLAARLFLVGKAPVPLSAADILRYDPSLSRGAAQRALSSLVDGGWLIVTERVGQKSAYEPSWGRVNGAPVPWIIGATCLNRPRHIRAVCLDLRLLDLFLGKLTPQPKRAAVITRYVTAPLLALADVGSYALLLGGLPGATPRLVAWGLTRDEQPLPLPDDTLILARASQRRLFDKNDTSLTARGLQKAGLIGPPAATDSAQPLFFVPPEVIADWPIQVTANLIDQRQDAEGEFAAPQHQNQASSAIVPGITWESLGSLTTQQESSPAPLIDQLGGGVISVTHENTTGVRGIQSTSETKIPKVSRPVPILPDTVAARSLTAINVLPDQVAELADTPITVVNDAIRDGQARPYVRDLAGWVVTLIRAQRDQGWKITPPAPRHDSPEALREAFGHYAAAQAAEVAEDLNDDLPVPQPPAPARLAYHDTRIRLWNNVLATLQHQLTRQEFTTWIRPATLHAIAGGMATIAVPDMRVKEVIEGKYRALLRDLLTMHVGEPTMVQVILNGAHATDSTVQPSCNQSGTVTPSEHRPSVSNPRPNNWPNWISAACWETLPAMLRAALIGSTFEDGQVKATSPYLDRLLQVRYAEAVATLIKNVSLTHHSPPGRPS
jgi:DnaA N-terminal domain